ncbi:hypothetical protein MRB53_011408 [Persea americana]|uniref:Uncharacterized protein n=1 Tax=Persea americana TaxID=3435 RepID=A0ACC2LUW3_PERAE|nr:hypothetical protein MRB53_011408 [Persea americana]
MNSDDQTLTKSQELAHGDPLPVPLPAKGCGPSYLEKGNLKKPYHQNLGNEGENNNSCTINVPSLSTNQSQGNEPNTSPQKSTLTEIIQSRPINNSTSIYLTTLEAKSMLRIGFTGLIGLLSVSYKINGNGNIVPTVLFHQPTNTFTLLLIVFMVIFYLAAFGLALDKAFPKITEVFKIISFVFLVLGATILLWALIPKNISWIPWIFFACTAAVVFGVLVLERFTDKRAASKSTASRPPV